MCGVIVFLLRKEISSTDFNLILKNKSYYTLAFHGLKYCLFAHALSAILFGSSEIITDDLISTYLVMPFYAVVMAAIVEETVYRKIIFGYISGKSGFWVGAAVSSFIFAVAHFNINLFPAYFLVGISLCYVYHKAGHIFPAMIVHGALNFISILVRTLKG